MGIRLWIVGLALACAVTALPGTRAMAQAGPSVSEAREAPRAQARPRREPSIGQIAARERQRKCGAEWREAKAAGKTEGQRWPQYWSKCNARLKGNAA